MTAKSIKQNNTSQNNTVSLKNIFQLIYQTRGRMFLQEIQELGSGLKLRRVFFNPLQGVWIPDETLFGVFDTVFQTDH